MYVKEKCQPHLWLLTGTSEGRIFTESLLRAGWRITVSVVSERAALSYMDFPLENILVGPIRDEDEIRSIIVDQRINQNGFHCVVDITHPFATIITSSITKVCRELNQPLIRYERLIENTSNSYLIKSFSDLSNYDLQGKSILMAIGARKLEQALYSVKDSGAIVYARVLANPESLKLALSSSIQKSNLAILNPSIYSNGSVEEALLRRWLIDGVVCRQSGGAAEKLWHEISSRTGIKLWLIRRPSICENIVSINSFEKLTKGLSSIKIK